MFESSIREKDIEKSVNVLTDWGLKVERFVVSAHREKILMLRLISWIG